MSDVNGRRGAGRALIVEQGNSRGAVAALRALAAAGWSVGVGAPGARGLAAASRSCAWRHNVPEAHADAERFLAGVRAAVGSVGYDVVFGAGEAEVMALSAGRNALDVAVPYASHDVVLSALDKTDLEAAATAAGLAVPATLRATDLEGPEPFVVKARRHAAPERPGAPPRVDTNVVFGAEAARRRVTEIAEVGAEAMVQQFYDGPLLAYAVVTDRDCNVVADSMQVASRIWPPFAGASCRAATIAVDETISAAVHRLLASTGWFGLAELQFVVPGGDVPRLIDLNGRFYGSLSLAVAAGANLPAVWAELAVGRQPLPVRARSGVRYQWLEADLRRALVEREGGVVRDVATTVAAGIGATHSLLERRDVAPALLRLRALARGV